MKASYSLKMKPENSKPDDYELDSVWVEVEETDLFLPEGLSSTYKSIILVFEAFRLVLTNAALLGLISVADAISYINTRRAAAKAVLPVEYHEFIGIKSDDLKGENES